MLFISFFFENLSGGKRPTTKEPASSATLIFLTHTKDDKKEKETYFCGQPVSKLSYFPLELDFLCANASLSISG